MPRRQAACTSRKSCFDNRSWSSVCSFFFQAEDGIRALTVTGVQTCALPICRDWLRAVAQLSEYRLIDWTPLEDQSGMGLLSGFAKINDFGVKVLEAGVASPISISIDESRRTTVPQQQQALIATSTPQQQAITKAVEKVITAINQADVSEQEKNEAKSLLRKLLGSKAAARVLGAGAQSIVV